MRYNREASGKSCPEHEKAAFITESGKINQNKHLTDSTKGAIIKQVLKSNPTGSTRTAILVLPIIIQMVATSADLVRPAIACCHYNTIL